MADSTPHGSKLVILAKALPWLGLERPSACRNRCARRLGRPQSEGPRPLEQPRILRSVGALASCLVAAISSPGGKLMAALGLLAACAAPHTDATQAPTVVFPTHFAEGSNPTALPVAPGPAAASDPGDAGTESDATAHPAGGAPAPPRTGTPPDPPPLRASNHYVYLVVHDRGQVSVQSVGRWRSRTPLPTARSMGRYAIELWIGRELVDRVRFDFPMLAAEPAPQPGPRRPLHEPPSLSAGAVVTRRVVVPASQRATRAVLVDRATGVVHPLPWPPQVQTKASDSSSGPP
jgi:hypothetical protein